MMTEWDDPDLDLVLVPDDGWPIWRVMAVCETLAGGKFRKVTPDEFLLNLRMLADVDKPE